MTSFVMGASIGFDLGFAHQLFVALTLVANECAKLLGAGGGGFMLFYAPPSKHNAIKDKLKDKLFVPFRFENTGSKIVYFSHE